MCKKENTIPLKQILLVHGSSYSSHEFDIDYQDYSLVRKLAREGYAVWRIDIAGYGQSEEVEDGFMPDTAYAAEDIYAAAERIMQISGQTKIDVLGYWAAYEAKTYRKLKAWEYEQEYRITLANTFYSFNKPESRNLKYDPKVLKGIIFGINTSEYDKKQIMEKLLERGDKLSDFVFYQAEYDDVRQEIVTREKKLWKA